MEDLDQLKTLIEKVPYVAFCAHSVGGEGFYCLIPIKNPEKHREHFRSLQMDFARSGITIDGSCINVGRDRFVSYDPEYYYNPDALVYDMFVSDVPKPQPNMGKDWKSMPMDAHITPRLIDELIQIIEEREIDMTTDYNDWFALGCSIANYFGKDGRERFHTISKFHPGYSPKQTDAKFDDALRNINRSGNNSIGTFIQHARRAGITALADFSDSTEESI